MGDISVGLKWEKKVKETDLTLKKKRREEAYVSLYKDITNATAILKLWTNIHFAFYKHYILNQMNRKIIIPPTPLGMYLVALKLKK